MDQERLKELIAELWNTPGQKDKLARVVAALRAVTEFGGATAVDAREEHFYRVAFIDTLMPFFS